MLTASVESKGFVIPNDAYFHDSTTLIIVGRREDSCWQFDIDLVVVHRIEKGIRDGKPVFAYSDEHMSIGSATIHDTRLRSHEAMGLVKRWLTDTQCRMFGLRMSFIDQTPTNRDMAAKAIAFILRTPEITSAFEDEAMA